MYLVFVNLLGPDYKGERIYEFIFSENLNDDIVGDDWDVTPASTKPKPPDVEHIHSVGTLSDTDLVFDLVQNSDYFSYFDAVDGVVAIAWESYDSEFSTEDQTEKRLVFRFGEPIDAVTKKLKERKLVLKLQKIS